MYVYACTKSNHLQASIEPHPSIDCCCRFQECYPCRILASHGIAAVQSTCIRPLQSQSHLFETCPGAYKLTGATYSAMQHGMCSTPTDPLIYLQVIMGICIATYLKYTNSSNSRVRLGFSYLGHIRVKSGSAVVTRFQCCTWYFIIMISWL